MFDKVWDLSAGLLEDVVFESLAVLSQLVKRHFEKSDLLFIDILCLSQDEDVFEEALLVRQSLVLSCGMLGGVHSLLLLLLFNVDDRVPCPS